MIAPFPATTARDFPVPTILAIDPGLDGAVAVLRDGKIIDARRRKGLDEAALLNEYPDAVVYCESPPMINGRWNTGTVWLLQDVAFWRGLCKRVGQRFETATVDEWQTVTKGPPGTAKDRSVARCKALHPEVNLKPGKCEKPHDGIADAVNLADYGAGVERLGAARAAGGGM